MHRALRPSLAGLRRRPFRPPLQRLHYSQFIPPSQLGYNHPARLLTEEQQRIYELEDVTDGEEVGPSYEWADEAEAEDEELEEAREKEAERQSALSGREVDPATVKMPPSSPSFYSARAQFYDQLTQIENAVEHTRSALKMLQLLPLPDFARRSLPIRHPAWKTAREIAGDLGIMMSSARYRALTRQLSKLNEYLRIAHAAGAEDLRKQIRLLIGMFEDPTRSASDQRGWRKPIFTDRIGRSYTFGKRKTSTARVWMVPVDPPTIAEREVDVIDLDKIQSLDEAGALLASQPDRFHEPQVVPTTSILINNIPLGEFFSVAADRERVVRPLKVAGMLSAFNVFTLVRGGGTTGQSGALAHGIAKGLVAHLPDLETLLRRTKLLRRDPRMVERKKPGKAKARKAYTWVKR
uniref:Ribosomal protein S5 domain 2-like protein n=1 Tax=Mycena chlorophos TaxID=658473 RepID=A0ABQ0L0D8_MYCCL|nr:predicted protein [Mycena chlorophos]